MLKKYDWSQIEGPHEIFQSFVTTLASGFYISFKGVFLPESRFAIVYTAFSYMGMNHFISEILLKKFQFNEIKNVNMIV